MQMFRSAAALILAALYFGQTFAKSTELNSSTYLRAAFSPVAITTDSTGNIYLAGNAVLDPLTGRQSVPVVKLNPQGTQYLYETYIRGSAGESAGGIAVDSAGNAYVAGTTQSADFPLTTGGALTTPATGFNDYRPFLTRLDPNGVITFSSIFGGPGGAGAVAISADGNILVSGGSARKGFPSTPNAYSVPDTTNRPFVVKLDPRTPKILFS